MALKRIISADQNLQLVQDATASALGGNTSKIQQSVVNGKTVFTRSQVSPPFSGGNLVMMPLTSGQDNLLPHGLGRLPSVWTVARLDTNTTVWEATTTALATPTQISRSASTQYLNLKCSSSCNIVIWVN